MSQENSAAGNAEQGNAPAFNLQRVYIKDLSLELPHAPEIFLEQESPSVEVNIGIAAQRLSEVLYESAVTITVTTKIEDKVLYLIEATQGGIFQLTNIPEDQVDPLLGIVCPSMLYPYLRANVADAITRASLPPLHLTDVNFQALYQQRLEQAQQEAQQQPQEDSGIILPPGATRQ